MNQRTRLSIVSCLLIPLVSACKGGDAQSAKPHQQKVTPVSLRNLSQQNEAEAWALFDRSTSQGFQPIPSGASEQTYLLQLPIETKLTQLKMFGPAPYLLTVQNESGEPVSSEAIDLSKNSSGWNQFTIASEDELSAVQLHFVSLGEVGSVSELELWGESPRFSYPKDKNWLNNALSQELAVLPPQFIKNSGEPTELQLEPLPAATSAQDGCQQVFFHLEQDPRSYRRAWVSYQATNLLRSFALTKGLNQDGLENGKWLAPATTDAFQNFTEELDIEALLPGLNTWTLCLPFNATHQVSLKNISLWGELETGDDFLVGALSKDQELPALLDGELSTAVMVDGLVHFSLTRAVSPDQLLVDVKEAPQKISIFCARPESRELLVAEQQLQVGENRVSLKNGSCDALQVEFSGPSKISEVALIGSGAKERTDWPLLVLNNADNFGGEAVLDGFFKAPSRVTGPIQANINGQTLPTLDGIFAKTFARNLQNQPWLFELSAQFADGQKLSKTITLEDSSLELEAALSRQDSLGFQTQFQTPHNTKFGEVGQSVSKDVLAAAAATIELGSDVSIEVPAGSFRRPEGTSTARKKDKDQISIKRLGRDELPQLPPELVNVTAPDTDGYEFLPHGSQFAPAATVTIPYSDSLLPESSTVNDVQTYFYDEEAERWEPLEKLIVDVGQKMVKSKTTHFTIMINAVLATPEHSGPAGFTPTDLSSIAAADPAAGIDLIQPPSANSSGDASVSFPMWVPAGRGGYSPSLGLSYSSGGGSGWVGTGWDLRVSNIQIDTRFGIPRYELGEEPIYTLDGQSLVSVPKESGITDLGPNEQFPDCSNGTEGERYQPRVEGSFFYILRCGNAPFANSSNPVYTWEVLDRSGTRYFYGTSGQSRLQHVLPEEAYNPGKIAVFAWYLEKVVDIDGNTTLFAYAKDGGDTSEFVQIYPSRIDYTSHQTLNLNAQYSIIFGLDDVIDTDKARKDQTITGRAGFLIKTRHLLRSVDVRFGDITSRKYVLVYEEGQFRKTRLKKIQVLGAEEDVNCGVSNHAFENGCLQTNPQFFYEHTFDYYEEQKAFGPIQEWNVQAENEVADAAINQSRNLSGDLSLYGGLAFPAFQQPIDPIQVNLGLQATGSLGVRQEKLGFYDINGDGLADIFSKDGDTTDVIMNQFDALSNNCVTPGECFFDKKTPSGDTLPEQAHLSVISFDPGSPLDELSKDFNASIGASLQGSIQSLTNSVSGSFGGSYGVSTNRKHMTDINGDGFLDQMQDEKVLLSERCDLGGLPRICYRPAVFTANSTVNVSNDPDLQAAQDQLAPPVLDAVRKWTAPFDGVISVDSSARLLHSNSDLVNRDGVRIFLFLYHPPTNATDVGSFDPDLVNIRDLPFEENGEEISEITMAEDAIVKVSRGDVILLRVSTKDDVPYNGITPVDEVEINLNISYIEATNRIPDSEQGNVEFISESEQELMIEPTGFKVYVFDAQKDFRLSGAPPTVFQAPMSGTIIFHNEWIKLQSSDTLRACIQKFEIPPFDSANPNPGIKTDRPCDQFLGDKKVTFLHDEFTAPGQPQLEDMQFTTNTNDLLVFRIESDFPFDPNELQWNITADYTEICLPDGSCREPIEEELPLVHYKKDAFTAYYPTFFKDGETRPASLLLSPGAGQMWVSGCVDIEGIYSGLTPSYLAIRSPHRLIAKNVIASDGDCFTFQENIFENEAISFELSIPNDGPPVSIVWTPIVFLDVTGFQGIVPVIVQNQINGAFRPEINKNTPDIFTGGLHQWGYGFINRKSESTEQELARAFVLPFADIQEEDISKALQNALEQGDINSLTEPGAQAAFYLMTTFFPAHPKALGNSVSGPVGIWEGPSGSIFISADRAHSAQLAEIPTIDIPSAEGSESMSLTQQTMTQMKGVARASSTRSFSLSASASSPSSEGSFSIGIGRTLNKVDVLDLDGDGIVDSVQPNSEGSSVGSWVKGKLFRPEATFEDFNAPLARKTSSALSRKLGSSFVTNFGASVGLDPLMNIVNSAGRLVRTKLGLSEGGGLNLPFSGGVGIGIARNRMVQDLIDINGDGLPDQVFRNSAPGYCIKHNCDEGDVVVRYNLGGYFSTQEFVLDAANWSQSAPSDGQMDDFDPKDEGGNSQDKTVLQSILGLFEADENEDRPTHFTTNVLKSDTSITRNFNLGFAVGGPGLGGGVDAGFTSSSSRTVSNVTDLNGDGLPDLLLKKDGDPIRVQYNLGDRFSPPELWNDENGGWSTSTNSNLLGPDSVIGQDILVPAGLPLALSGVPAPLAVAIDNQVQKLTGPDVLSGTGYFSSFSPLGISLGAYLKGVIPLGPFGLFGLSLRGGLGFSADFDSYELAMLDINGDGAPEHVLRLNHLAVKRNGEDGERGDGKFYVKPNMVTGKANLLKKIRRPLGGSITVDYSRSRNTVDLPQSRYVMTSVEVDDGVQLGDVFDSPNVKMTYNYEDGYFDRGEKEFFGFSKVTSIRADNASTQEIFENRDYTKKGMLLSSASYDVDGGTVLSSSENNINKVLVYHDDDPNSNCHKRLHVLQPSTACDVNFPIVELTDTLVKEASENQFSILSKTSRQQNLAYDDLGNILSSLDEADDASSADDVYSSVTYKRILASWIIGLPETITVRAGSASGSLLRFRSGTYDNKGNLVTLTTQTEKLDHSVGTTTNRFVTTTFEYDNGNPIGVGNVTKVTGPALPGFTQRPNLAGQVVSCDPILGNQRQIITYQYDTEMQQFVETVAGDFGLSAKSFYDPKFGVLVKTIDTNSNQINKFYDRFGRLYQVFGPYDIITGPAAIEMSYFPAVVNSSSNNVQVLARAVTVHHISKPTEYDQSLFAQQLSDQETQNQRMTTVTIVDGLDRPIQVKKSATVGGNTEANDKMLVSAPVVYDELGRIVTTFQPFTTPGQNLTFQLPTLAIFPQAERNPTTVNYDVRGRVLTTVYPDNTSDRMQYAIGSFQGSPQFLQISTDANNHIRKSYTDGAGRSLAVIEPTGATTKYFYDPLSQLTSVVDASTPGHTTTMGYDLRGLRLRMQNPDTGLLKSFYDDAGHLVASQDPNHNSTTTEIRYGYDKGRLVCIDYPQKEDVYYTYGTTITAAPLAQQNYAKGRLAIVQDESGREAYRYGKMGEVISSDRLFNDAMITFNGSEGGVGPQGFRMAYDSFGRQLSLTYPDGEVVRYFYNLGGSVKEVRGLHRFKFNQTNTMLPIPYAANIQYDKFGNKTHAEFSNGTISNWSYEPKRVRLDRVETTMNVLSGSSIVQTKIQDLSYSYDNIGNPTAIESKLAVPSATNAGKIPGKGFWSFTYDSSDRLETVNGCTALSQTAASTYSETFGYDNIHNLTSKVRNRVEKNITGSGNDFAQLCQGTASGVISNDDLNLTYTYNPAKPHQVSAVDGQKFMFDGNGNLLKKGVGSGRRTFIWDDDNKLVEVLQGSAGETKLIRNFYDADGLRAKKYSDTFGETLFVSPFFDIQYKKKTPTDSRANNSIAYKHIFIGGWRIASELMNYNPTTRGALPESDVENQTGPVMHFHSDHLGSTGLLTAGTSPVINPNVNLRTATLHEHVEYYADGDTWVDKADINPPINGYRFSGKFFDPETGLYDFGARFYDPKLSLWLSNDPALIDGSSPSPMMLSSYAYANQSPLAFIDPDGRAAVAPPTNPVIATRQKISSATQGPSTTKKPKPKREAQYTLKSMTSGAVGFVYGGAKSLARGAAVGLASETPYVGPVAGWLAGRVFDEATSLGESLVGAGFSALGVSDEAMSAFSQGEDYGNSAVDLYKIFSSVKSQFESEIENDSLDRDYSNYYVPTEILDGGVGNFTGHGGYSSRNGETVVPEGTSFTMPQLGISIPIEMGLALEENDIDAIMKNPTWRRIYAGTKTYLPGQKVPNLTLYPPGGIPIRSNSRTVMEPTLLQDLLFPGMGNVCWTNCTFIEP